MTGISYDTTAYRRVARALGIYLVGQLVTMALVRLLHVDLVNPLETFTANITNSQLVTAARQLFIVLVMAFLPKELRRGAAERGPAVRN